MQRKASTVPPFAGARKCSGRGKMWGKAELFPVSCPLLQPVPPPLHLLEAFPIAEKGSGCRELEESFPVGKHVETFPTASSLLDPFPAIKSFTVAGKASAPGRHWDTTLLELGRHFSGN